MKNVFDKNGNSVSLLTSADFEVLHPTVLITFAEGINFTQGYVIRIGKFYDVYFCCEKAEGYFSTGDEVVGTIKGGLVSGQILLYGSFDSGDNVWYVTNVGYLYMNGGQITHKALEENRVKYTKIHFSILLQ